MGVVHTVDNGCVHGVDDAVTVGDTVTKGVAIGVVYGMVVTVTVTVTNNTTIAPGDRKGIDNVRSTVRGGRAEGDIRMIYVLI